MNHSLITCSSRVDLLSATPDQLDALQDACEKATFGRGSEDVLDETYRKAGKLDAEDFSLCFEAELRAALLDIVTSELTVDCGFKNDTIRAQLYKLNVYGTCGAESRRHAIDD